MSKAYKSWVEYLADNKAELEVDGPDADHSDLDFIVCRLKTEPLLMQGNLLGHCVKCFRLVQFRPHAPREPKRICDECAAKQFSGDNKFVITRNTAQDLAEHFKKRKLS